MKKRIVQWSQRSMSVLLVLSMLFTSVPVQAFAAEAPVPRIPVSAPFDQPEPVDYEAQQRAADGSAGASASTPDSIPAESAPPVSSSASQAASSSQSASAEHRKTAACRPAVRMRSRPETAAQPWNPSPRRMRLPLSRNPQVFLKAPVK